MKKRVLFLITKATWGGAQKYVYDIATGLPKDQFDITVVYGQEGRLAENLRGASHIQQYALSSLKRDVAFISDIRSFFEIAKHIKSMRPDIVHLNSSKAAALGALAARACGARRIIFTVHGWPFKEPRGFFARSAIYVASWLTALLSHVTIVVSKTDEHIGKRMWLVGKKIHRVPIGIDPPAFLSREESLRALSLPTVNAALRIVTIAELTPNKGIGFAIKAIAKLKERGTDVIYTIIGDGEERIDLAEQIRRLDVTDRVFLKGFVPNASRYLKAFDLFLLPSIKEGMPYVLLEAAAADLPIIATNIVDRELVSVHIEPASVSAIADAIENIRTNQGEKVTSSQATRNSMIEKTIELYRN